MPITKAGDINIEYYIEGEGPPLLMIMGMGGQSISWGEPFLEQLRRNFKIIRFSNRGTGLSDKSSEATTVPQMAADTDALMAALGIEKARVFGVSMGGMIAQELVISYPNRVQALVLGCTACGPAHSVPVPPETVAKFGGIMSLPVDDRIREFWNFTITPEFIESGKQFLDDIIARSLETPTPMETFGKQFSAVQSFDTYDRLPQIKAPTLIIHGDRDALVPVGNAGILHSRIAGSHLKIIPGVGHCFFWEKPEESAAAIVGFLSKVPVAA